MVIGKNRPFEAYLMQERILMADAEARLRSVPHSKDFIDGMITMAYAFGYECKIDDEGKPRFSISIDGLPSKNIFIQHRLAVEVAPRVISEAERGFEDVR